VKKWRDEEMLCQTRKVGQWKNMLCVCLEGDQAAGLGRFPILKFVL
jgi:hypothetical protein